MAIIDHYQPGDARATSALSRRVFGPDDAERHRLRWDWQYRKNPYGPPEGPPIWVAREGTTIIGQHATMPVRLQVAGHEIPASWGLEVMVAPERQRQGLGEQLIRTWDHQTAATMGLGVSDASQRLFSRLRWPSMGPIPCLVKPLTRRAFRRPNWPMPVNRLVSAVTLPFIRLIARARPLGAGVVPITRFDATFTALWERLAPKFAFCVRRDGPYLNWKFLDPPDVRYHAVALMRGAELHGYAVYRHVREPRGRVTQLIDFLTDPDDEAGLVTLLGWLDREARAEDSDKVRVYCLHDGFRRVLRHAGYFSVRSALGFVAKINALPVPPAFYHDTKSWHVTLGDADLDH
jgi:GNAT superfamily N-acetyltransferase